MSHVTAVLPLAIFVQRCLADKPCQDMINAWPIKLEAIHEVVIKHLEDLGIYEVGPFMQAEVLKEEIKLFLEHSPTLIEMVEKAKRIAAQNAAKNRNLAS